MEDARLAARTMIEQDEGILWELWLLYWANGGDAKLFEFEAYVHGAYEPNESDMQVLAWSVEEMAA
jgi:hypothetical protein